MPLKVLVTRPIFEIPLQLLQERFEVEINPEDRSFPRQVLLEKLSGKDGMLCLLTDRIDREVLDAGAQLRVVANCAVGYDNIDVETATELGIAVTNTPGVLTDATSELALTLLMSTARRIPEADRFARAGHYKEWALTICLGSELKGKTLGILGAGRIGTAVALKARGLELEVLYTDVRRNEILENELGAVNVELAELLERADFLTIHLNLSDETRHIIGKKELNRMKKSAILINTSRGPVVDETALVNALRNGEIRAAGLDVYEREPEIDPGLLELENVVLLPHIGSATWETRTRMADLAVRNVIAVLDGEIPPSLVNREVLDAPQRRF
jgi:lactate dehydrogenase-like 2-hydroxyacid dehydrogenase